MGNQFFPKFWITKCTFESFLIESFFNLLALKMASKSTPLKSKIDSKKDTPSKKENFAVHE